MRKKPWWVNNQPRQFLHWLIMGEKFGYPRCCVLQFARECLSGLLPAKLRGLDKTGRYVPCDKCKEEMRKMTNDAKLKSAILKEYNAMLTGDQYIENCADAARFIAHLVYLITYGQQGEEQKFLSDDDC